MFDFCLEEYKPDNQYKNIFTYVKDNSYYKISIPDTINGGAEITGLWLVYCEYYENYTLVGSAIISMKNSKNIKNDIKLTIEKIRHLNDN